ncbi:hypothetical protein Tsubulata_023540, partial [Turnera subulata]
MQATPLKQVVASCAYSTKKVLDIGQPTSATHPELLKEGEITPGITSEEYIARRNRLLELLPDKSLAIIAAAPVKMMTDVVPYTFRQDANYQYITGCQQPGGVAVLGHDCGLCMFMPEATPHDIIWQGQVAGVDTANETFKADQAYPMSKLRDVLPDMIKRCSKLFHNIQTASPSYTELEAFQMAAVIGKALLQTMFHSKTYPHERMLAAKFEYESKMRGAQRMAFNPVVGGGPNASVIHYSRNDQKGDLVLMDVGCELHGYVSDLTRTWPPCGSFSSVQEELYNLILETNKDCLQLCRPGSSIREIHNYSVEKLRKGLGEIGILKDRGSHYYHQINPTSIGHYLGMDVHDSSSISYDRPLRPGVVITIEPGVYIPSVFDCPERYRGIGIRIEDEVLITETGYEVLTGSMPKEVKHIESLLNNYSYGTEMESQNKFIPLEQKMGDFVLTLVLEEILKKLGWLALEGIDLAWGFKGKLQKLNESLTFIRAVLHDAEERQAREETVKIWLVKLRDVAYEAEDVLDEFGYEVLRQKVESSPSGKTMLHSKTYSHQVILAAKFEYESKVRGPENGCIACLNRFNPVVGGRPNASVICYSRNDQKEALMILYLKQIRNVCSSGDLNAASLAAEGIHLAWGFKENLQKLNETFSFMQTVLRDAEERQGREESVKIWLGKLQDVAYEAEDVLDEFGYEVLRRKVETPNRFSAREVRKFFSASNPIVFRIVMGLKIKKINSVLEEIKKMLENLAGKNTGSMRNLDTILRQLKEALEGKKFLLVLDDVWNEEVNKWESLKERLSIVSGSNGNAIIVTTRSRKTASMMETSPGIRHELEALKDEECWSIIQETVGSDRGSISRNLEKLGMDIAKKCGGLPLAARMLGGLMRSSKEENHWLSIKNNSVWDS